MIRYALWLPVLWLCMAPLLVDAATYYVSPSGNDSAKGSSSAPFRTVKRGITALNASDTLILRAGTYVAGDLAPPSGTAGAPTILRGEPAGQATIRGTGQAGSDTIFLLNGRSYVTLDGLVLDGSDVTSFPIYADNQAHHITVINSEVTRGRQSGFLVQGSHWEVRNNRIHHNGRNCCATHSDDHGMYFSAAFSVIAHNYFENPNACYNIQNYGGPNPTNNTFDSNVFTNSKCGVTLTHGSHHVFTNNLSYNDSTYYDRNGLLIFTPNTRVDNNTLSRVNILTINAGDSPSVQIHRNTLCQGRIEAVQASVSDNRLTCDGVDVERLARELGPGTRPAGPALPPAPPQHPAPKNLRVRPVP